MKFVVTIEETVVQDFEIEAKSIKEAEDNARDMYKNGKLVVCDGELQYAQMRVRSKGFTEEGEWTEIDI